MARFLSLAKSFSTLRAPSPGANNLEIGDIRIFPYDYYLFKV
ncbi:hypothetical protein ABHI18_000095 [Aspergillus niger]